MISGLLVGFFGLGSYLFIYLFIISWIFCFLFSFVLVCLPVFLNIKDRIRLINVKTPVLLIFQSRRILTVGAKFNTFMTSLLNLVTSRSELVKITTILERVHKIESVTVNLKTSCRIMCYYRLENSLVKPALIIIHYCLHVHRHKQ